jgi:hypothetical protein
VGVSTIRVLVNRLGTRTGEELPGRWVCRPENRPSMEVRLVWLTRRWTARRCMLLSLTLSAGSPRDEGLTGWFGKGKQMRLGAVLEQVMV